MATVAVAGSALVTAPSALAAQAHDHAAMLRGASSHTVTYGPAVAVGNGVARTYLMTDPATPGTPLEFGIAVKAMALGGLATEGMTAFVLPLPEGSPAPYEHVVMDWIAAGHEPPGIYDTPHFDFHFYLVSEAEVRAIDPADAAFAAKANRPLDPETIPAQHLVLTPPGADWAAAAIPAMGVHWSDVRSPELQGMLGDHAAHRPFTRTFLYGSWDGRMIFLEPMITRAYLLTKPDEVIPVHRPARVPEAGWYPEAYRVTYDEPTDEYRIGLVGLAWVE